MNNNRKRTRARYNQTIICANGKVKQIKHPHVPEPSASVPWGMGNEREWEIAMRRKLAETHPSFT